MEFNSVLVAFVFIGILLAIGKWLRVAVPFFQNYFIPTSLIAGIIGLLLSKEVLGKLPFVPGDSFLSNGIFTEGSYEAMTSLPEIAITIIFASLFLGKKIPGIKKIWSIAGPQVAYGQSIAWGQYVIGIVLALTVLQPFFNMSPMAGALIEIGFQGGPGTAAGLRSTFEDLGFSEGSSLALGLAMIGILTGVISGIILVNWGIRKGYTKQADSPSSLSELHKKGLYPKEEDAEGGLLTTRTESIDSLTSNFMFIFIATGVGMLLLRALVMLENATWGSSFEIIRHVPLFPMALLGGVLTQLIYSRFIPYKLIDRKFILRIQGFALDVLIVSAITTLSLSAIGQHIWPFLILAAAGITWNILAFLFLAKRIMPNYWFERGIIDYGQSMGMTTTGLLLLQIVDPDKETPAFEAFGYKQILFEPIIGGGLFTAASMPLIHSFGAIPVLIITASLLVIWLGVGLFYFGRKKGEE
ncbi:sodium/glutamate symporter [Bacillus sp. AK031]